VNNRSLFGVLAIAALAIAIGVAIGIGAYNAGVAQGIAQSSQAIAAQPPAGTPVYFYPRPWGYGFFPFFPILFFFFFLFFCLRGLFWRGRWGGGWGYRHGGIPPAFDEWHRRAHEQPPPASTPPARSTNA
jgi:hypothetical protein